MSEPKWELFVFDWDGTIMDTTILIARGIQEAARTMGLNVPDIEAARGAIGLGWSDIIASVCPDCPVSRYDEFGVAYRNWYIRREAEVELFPYLREMLEGMHRHGLRLAIATGKSRAGMERVFALTGLAPLFEAVRTADMSFSKPNPAMLFELSDETGVETSKMVMVGDAIHDLWMASNAGSDGIGVTFGSGNEEDLRKVPHVAICKTVPELAKALGVLDILNEELARAGKSPVTA